MDQYIKYLKEIANPPPPPMSDVLSTRENVGIGNNPYTGEKSSLTARLEQQPELGAKKKPEPLFGGEPSISNRGPLTMREKFQFGTQDALIELFGFKPYKAVELSKKLFGGSPEDTSAPGFGIGLADLMGLGEIFAIEEGLDQAERGNITGDKGDELMGTGIALAGSIAPAVIAKRIISSPQARNFLQEAKDRFEAGLSPIPVGMSIENVGDAAKLAPDAPPFYSAVDKAVDALPQDKGSGDQMRAMILKSEGVKPDEMAWIGLDDFLKGKKSVTKQEIKNYVEANQVRIEEVTKGFVNFDDAIKKAEADGEINAAIILKRGKIISEEGDMGVRGTDTMSGTSNILNAARQPSVGAWIEKLPPSDDRRFMSFDDLGKAKSYIQTRSEPKFGGPKTTLPGGENYREVLLTLPSRKRVARPATQLETERGFSVNEAGDVEHIGGTDTVKNINDDFRGGHFDEPNVLAHVRLNDRTGPNGEKILFVEEIQSDWHQMGRDKGYNTPERQAKIDALKEKRKEILDTRDANRPDWWERYHELDELSSRMFTGEIVYDEKLKRAVSGRMSKKEQEEFAILSEKYLEFTNETIALLIDVDSEITSLLSNIPDAPMKKSWHEMSFRRIARMAAEEGYDSVAWTPGKIQADRYSLSKQVDNIEVVPRTNAVTGEKSRSVDINLPNGDRITLGVDNAGVVDNTGANNTDMKGKHLSDILGKEMADKIMKNTDQIIKDADLKVGGEGMKGFYDKMVKKYAENWGKKFGAKVETTNIETGIKTDVSGIDIIENNGKWTVIDRPNGGAQLADFSNKSDAEAYIVSLEIVAQGEAKPKVWSMKITQKMRDSLMKKGVPMFGVAGTAATIGMQGQDNGD